jgi:hypothetical protein
VFVVVLWLMDASPGAAEEFAKIRRVALLQGEVETFFVLGF